MSLVLKFSKAARPAEMHFVDHLEVLRGHITRSLLAILVCSVVFFIYRDWMFDHIITGPINADFITYRALCSFSNWIHAGNALCMPPVEVSMQTTSFSGQFVSSISMAITGGFIVAFPYVFHELWRFVKPALKPSEIKGTNLVVLGVSACFFIGSAFGYFLLGPFTFNFLAGYHVGNNLMLVTRPTLTDYLENLTSLILGCGLAFELPVLAYVLTKAGLITPGLLKNSRRYAYVSILVISAVITPSPDWMSQLIVFLPLLFLYELSIIISNRIRK